METGGETLEQLELTVTDVVYGGKGLARLDGLVVFIPGTLTGEKVRVAKLTKHARFAEARAVEVLERSLQRVEPGCPLTGTIRSPSESCAGCCYQHATYAEEIRMKQAQFVNLLQRLGKTEPAVCLPAVASPLETGYRNKIVLHPGKARGGQAVLGYVAEDNKTILDVAACPLAMPALNDLLKNIRGDREFMASLDPDAAVTLRCTARDGAFHWPKPRGYSGPARLTEVAYFGDIVVSYKSFFQVNPAVGNLVAQAVTGIIAAAGCKVVVDLYGGTGILALAARKAGVLCAYGVDTDNRAIRAARANATTLGIDNVEFHHMPAADGLKKIGQGIKPTHTAVIVDPPRKGLEKEVAEVLLAMKPRRIVYVSCAADTLARDVARLAASGYRVKSAQLFDMFPRTALFESVTELELTSEK
jgi:tRNA/tmRNA/rRNA uracil-C5-methylase (TrmA/RlmC/RlmD family)